ncbi:radical SAM/SPASM domain-containing protein [Chryseobacterium sp. 3008163]|uniref:radical SAM/SPASM domain-containing protein n=1 Tax=Chryseobacterium sp. 3008163 TaxID=2478663 RepID=UPI000F0BEC93|nr:SPASM domain-containing protein [Chryseobacterium sp. 3008163]AYN00853.1 SPASM domain-containing protein [Chryseobacterium sp. 3008163]
MQYKLSHYLIFNDSLIDKNQALIYSTITNKLLRVSNLLAGMLQRKEFHKLPNETLEKLITDRIIVNENEDELLTVINENKQHSSKDSTLFEVIQPSAWCQLGCYYCGQAHKKDLLSDQTINNIANRIFEKLKKNSKYKFLAIGWFGGEPLTGMNTMRKLNNLIKRHCEDLNIELKNSVIVTNGMSLKFNIYKELVEDFKISQFEITIDGIGSYHDDHRYLKKDKEGSFDLIYKNITNILNSDFYSEGSQKITIRCNVDTKNFDGVEPLIKKLANDNLHNKIEHLYFASIYSWAQNNAHQQSLSKEEFAFYKLKWELLKIKHGYKTNEITKRKHNTCILTSNDSEMYDTYGNVYSCTEVSFTDIYKNSKYLLGNVNKSISDERSYLNWYDQVWEKKDSQCNSCKLFPICGSACPKSWMEGNPPCPTTRYNIKEEIQLQEIKMHSKTKSELVELLDSFEQSLAIENMKYS